MEQYGHWAGRGARAGFLLQLPTPPLAQGIWCPPYVPTTPAMGASSPSLQGSPLPPSWVLSPLPYFTTHPPHLGPWLLEVSRALTFSEWSPCARTTMSTGSFLRPTQLDVGSCPLHESWHSLTKSLLQLLTSITNRRTMNIHDESQTKILASARYPTKTMCGEELKTDASDNEWGWTLLAQWHTALDFDTLWKMKSFKRTYLFVFVKKNLCYRDDHHNVLNSNQGIIQLAITPFFKI